MCSFPFSFSGITEPLVKTMKLILLPLPSKVFTLSFCISTGNLALHEAESNLALLSLRTSARAAIPLGAFSSPPAMM